MPDVHGLEPLLQRALAKDGEALNELLARLRRYMHQQVREQLGAHADGRIDPSSIVQSAYRRVVVHFHKLEGPNVPLLVGWIGKIVENRVIDALRWQARHPAHSLGSDVLALADPKPSSESRTRAELAAEVASALVQLPARERRVVETRWFDPQPDEATARELGITVNYVRQLRFKALEKLRELLGHTVEASR